MPGLAMKVAGARHGKLKTVNGRLVSARSKTGDSQCSSAMSTWKTTGMTAAVAKILGMCRAKANALKKGIMQRAAGNEGKAQVLEHRAASGKVGIKARRETAEALKEKLYQSRRDRFSRHAKEAQKGAETQRVIVKKQDLRARINAARGLNETQLSSKVKEHRGALAAASERTFPQGKIERRIVEREVRRRGKTANEAPPVSAPAKAPLDRSLDARRQRIAGRVAAAQERAAKNPADDRAKRMANRFRGRDMQARATTPGMPGGGLFSKLKAKREKAGAAAIPPMPTAKATAPGRGTPERLQKAKELHGALRRSESSGWRVGTKDRLGRGRTASAGTTGNGAAPATARLSLREQVAAHRASKGSREERLGNLINRNVEKAADIGGRTGVSAARRSRLHDQRATRLIDSLQSRQTGTAAPARSTLREQAAAHRASKGSREERLGNAITRNVEKASDIGGKAGMAAARRSRLHDDRASRLVGALQGQSTSTAKAVSMAAPARSSLREQAAAHRASKGSREDRLGNAITRNVEKASDIGGKAGVAAARRSRLHDERASRLTTAFQGGQKQSSGATAPAPRTAPGRSTPDRLSLAAKLRADRAKAASTPQVFKGRAKAEERKAQRAAAQGGTMSTRERAAKVNAANQDYRTGGTGVGIIPAAKPTAPTSTAKPSATATAMNLREKLAPHSSLVGQSFGTPMGTVKVTGLNPRSKEKPVIVTDAAGKQHAMSAATAEMYVRHHAKQGGASAGGDKTTTPARPSLREQAAKHRAERKVTDSAGIRSVETPERRAERAEYLRDLRKEAMTGVAPQARLNSSQELHWRLGVALASTSEGRGRPEGAFGSRGYRAESRYKKAGVKATTATRPTAPTAPPTHRSPMTEHIEQRQAAQKETARIAGLKAQHAQLTTGLGKAKADVASLRAAGKHAEADKRQGYVDELTVAHQDRAHEIARHERAAGKVGGGPPNKPAGATAAKPSASTHDPIIAEHRRLVTAHQTANADLQRAIKAYNPNTNHPPEAGPAYFAAGKRVHEAKGPLLVHEVKHRAHLEKQGQKLHATGRRGGDSGSTGGKGFAFKNRNLSPTAHGIIGRG